MFSIFIKRSVLLLFTFAFFVGSFVMIQRYLHNNKPAVYPAVSNVQLHKQNAAANGEIQKLQTSISEGNKAETTTDQQYSNLIAEKNSLSKKQ